ncbi:hypothetical protein HanRHA438_Chr06g0265501 [Helianthus annuus]|nr:hypothetical protein HanRHA438_Chr06g0265501 [Helianthus annuus]
MLSKTGFHLPQLLLSSSITTASSELSFCIRDAKSPAETPPFLNITSNSCFVITSLILTTLSTPSFSERGNGSYV